MKKVISLLLTLCLMIPQLSVVAGAVNFSDTEGHWAQASIDRWSDYGVVNGVGGNNFDPEGNMTRAQAAGVLARLLNLTGTANLAFTDVAADAWYAQPIARCVAAGFMNGTSETTMSPDAPLTREQMFVLLGRVLGLEEEENCDAYVPDHHEISDYARGYVNMMINNSYVAGHPDGSVAPKDDITRAQVMKLLDSLITTYADEDGASVKGGGGIVLVAAENVTVTGSAASVAVAAGTGSVTLKNLKAGTVVVYADTAVEVTGSSEVAAVVIARSGDGAGVEVDRQASVETVQVKADDVTVSGSGTVETVEAQGNDATIKTAGTTVSAGEGTTGTTAGGKTVAAGESSTTASSTGSGSSSSSDDDDEEETIKKVTTFAELQEKILSAAGTSVKLTLGGDIVMTGTITIPAETAVELVDDGTVRTLSRGGNLTAALFDVPGGSTLTLSGTKADYLVLDGTAVSASAAMVTSAGMLEMKNALARNAVSSSAGGAVYLTGGTFTSTNTNYIHNSAKTGAAIDTRTKMALELTITGGSFTGNTAVGTGGAINLLDTNTMTLSGASFANNQLTAAAANKGGGALYIANTSAAISDCTFAGNTVAGDALSVGGAVCYYAVGASKTQNSLSGCTFTENTAPNGGALALSDSGKFRNNVGTLNWSGCTFASNTAADKGGAVVILYNCNDPMSCIVNIEKFTYENNAAPDEKDFCYAAPGENITVDGELLYSSVEENENYAEYEKVGDLPDITLTSGVLAEDLAGMAVVNGCAYSVKLKGNSGSGENYHLNEPGVIYRTDLATGETVLLTEKGSDANFVTYMHHANGVGGALINGVPHLFIATLVTTEQALVKIRINDDGTYEKVGQFTVLENGANVSKSGADVVSVDDEKTTLLLKTGGTFYTAELPHDQTEGTVTVTARFSVDLTGMTVNGETMDVSSYTWQDCGYDPEAGIVYVPVYGSGISAIVAYSAFDEDGNMKTGTLTPAYNQSVLLGDKDFRMLEAESCAVVDRKLYFNANRTTGTGEKDHDGVFWTTVPEKVDEPTVDPGQDVETTVTTFGEFTAAIEKAAGHTARLTLGADITATAITVIPENTTVEIQNDGTVRALIRGSELTEAILSVPAGSTLTLSGTAADALVLDGASVPAASAMVLSAGTLEMSNVLARDGVNSGTGGALYLTAGTFTSTNCNFTGNQAKSGGAIDVKKSGPVALTITGGSFTGNTATLYGGAIDMPDKNTLIATGTAFTGNKVTTGAANRGGGAVYAANATATLKECTFTENTTAGDEGSVGGAVCFYAAGATKRNCEIINCAFTKNSAPVGGAVAVSNNTTDRTGKGPATITMTGCTFTENVAATNGGAVAFVQDCAFMACIGVFSGCTWQGNVAANAADIYTATETDANVTVDGQPLAAPSDGGMTDQPVA